MEVTICKAELQELDTLIEWRMEVLREVFSVPKDMQMSELTEANRNYYKEMLLNEGHFSCFAWKKDEIIGCGGMCVYNEMPSPDNPTGKCAYLMNIYTRPQFRKSGVGEKVVHWLVKQARKNGITKIYLETSDSGRRLYEKMGFADMCGYMKLEKF